MPWAGGPIPHFDSLKAQIFLVQASVNQQSRDQQKDRNEIISFLTDIQLSQWHILDCQDSLRRGQKRLQDWMDSFKGHMADMESYVHNDFHCTVKGGSANQGPDNVNV